MRTCLCDCRARSKRHAYLNSLVAYQQTRYESTGRRGPGAPRCQTARTPSCRAYRSRSGGRLCCSCMCTSHTISLDNRWNPRSNIAARSAGADVPHWLRRDTWRRDLDFAVRRDPFRQGASVHHSSFSRSQARVHDSTPIATTGDSRLLGPSQTRSRASLRSVLANDAHVS